MRLMQLTIALSAILIGSAGLTFLTAQDSTGGGASTSPLDLPSGGNGSGDNDEDAPETISFYGGNFEGDGFFWLLDQSCSMEWGGRLAELKAEMTEALNSLSDNSHFGIVAFSDGLSMFNPQPLEGDSGNTASANAWVQTLQPLGLTCMAPAGVQCIQISNMSDKENKQIIVLGDGVPNCPGPTETVSAMTSANWENTPINTIYISNDTQGVSFMQSLAAANNGTYSQPQ